MNVSSSTPLKSLRLWPGVVAGVVLVLIRFVLPVVAPGASVFGVDAPLFAVIGGLLFAVIIALWWLFFSRAPWSERLIAIGIMIVAVVAIRPLTHMSIQGGMMGMMFYIYAVPPTLALALVIWAVVTRRLSAGPRRVAMVVAIVIGCAVWTLARTNGIHGGIADLEWRWTPTAEELLMAQASSEPPLPPPSVAEAIATEAIAATPGDPVIPAPTAAPGATAPDAPAAPAPAGAIPKPATPGIAAEALPEPSRLVAWPGFRGPARDGVVRGSAIETDWSASPPVEMWRRPIGPGWSSFAVTGDLLYTQEQRGDEEIVACYKVSSGEPVWRHRDATRFWESNGGAGPRGTPTLHNGRVYAMGATGILNALDARTGAVIWSRNAATDTGKTVPEWGLTSSPLVVDDLVMIAVSGQLAAYDVRTGNPRWVGQSGGTGYSSPHYVSIGGVPQVLLMRGARTISVAPADGAVLWEHTTGVAATSIVQPALVANGDVLLAGGDAMGGLGVRRVAVTRGPGGWSVEERWESRGLKPYFNDFVVHKGHAYGFDGSILASIDLADGARKWKGGRYGSGQLVLLADQDLLLVVSEEGELALVSATPDKFAEVARFPALAAKTWNHPAVIGDVLLVRNGEEMAAFRLPVAGR